MASLSLKNKTLDLCTVPLVHNGSLYANVELSMLPDACAEIILGHDFINNQKELKFKCRGHLPGSGQSFNCEIRPAFHLQEFNTELYACSYKSRRRSKADEMFIQQEIYKLLKEDIIEPSTSSRRAQVLVTTNTTHKKRMVVDCSQTIKNTHNWMLILKRGLTLW